MHRKASGRCQYWRVDGRVGVGHRITCGCSLPESENRSRPRAPAAPESDESLKHLRTAATVHIVPLNLVSAFSAMVSATVSSRSGVHHPSSVGWKGSEPERDSSS